MGFFFLFSCRGHFFDSVERCSVAPRRHSGTITDYGLPSRGSEGVRAYHRMNEEKILPHRRYGLKDEDIV